tara:strand:- start:2732 stop:3307 length:576 start_codon:yes stop_codon:yes gene_type:complete
MKNFNDKIAKIFKNKNSLKFLYFISFIESIFFPIPTDLFLFPIALIKKNKIFYMTFFTTIFSVFGGVIGYFIGSFFFNEIGEALLDYFKLGNQFDLFTNLIIEYGYIFIFIAGFTPIPYKIAAIGSGFISLPIIVFIVASFFSRGLRFLIVAYFGAKLGKTAERTINKYFFIITLLLLLIILLILAFEVIK